MKFSYKKLQTFIHEPLPDAETLKQKIIFHAFEVESMETEGDDTVFEIKVLPDRAGDCKDERGMAREIAGLFGLSLNEPDHYDSGESLIFNITRVGELLGRDVTSAEIRKVFDAYHYHYDIQDDTATLFVPPWRKDISNVHDITEEIGRYAGYENVPAILPGISKTPEINSEFAAVVAKKNEMVANGYHEVMTYSLVKKGDYQVAHGPKGKDFLRKDLLGGLRVAYALNKQNEELLPNHSAKIFEIGKVFPESGEELHVAWIDEKGEHEESLDTSNISSNYELPENNPQDTSFTMWSEYPFITRDIAVWIPESENVQDLVKIIKENGTEILLGEPRLFDQFSKDGKTSYAYRMVFQSPERTLTNEEVDSIMETITDLVKIRGWEVR